MKYLHTYFYKRATERENKKLCPLTKRKVNGVSAKSLVLTCYILIYRA